MEVPTDFGQRMETAAKAIPREVLANLLTRLMPVAQVTTRAPTQAPPVPTTTSRDPFTRSRAKRRAPRSANRPYKVLLPFAHKRHRKGTWTYAMVAAAVMTLDNKETQTTGVAEQALRAAAPEYDHKTIDWNWLQEQGYITFTF